MLHLDRPDRPLSSDILAAPGGFAWWYVDLFDASGNGLVCIWSYGLPFLPGYLSSRRAGRGTPAGSRPSVNLAVYRDGVQAAYTLLELPPERARWSPTEWTFGDSRFRRDGGALHAEVDLPVPGTDARLTGEFHVQGPIVQAHGLAQDDPTHAWTPLLGPSSSSVSLSVGGETLLETTGTGYHDRNGSKVPMDGLGLDHWIWSRQILGDELVITYLNFPDDGSAPYHVVVRVDAHGRLHTVPVELELGKQRRGTFGMPWWDSAVLHGLPEGPLSLTFTRPFDDGPFYLRTWTDASFGPHRARGIAELCRPHRIDLGWQRPLVKMCVQHETHRNSIWLPLFTGPHDSSVRRLFRHWTGL
jgi:hypothetical protein